MSDRPIRNEAELHRAEVCAGLHQTIAAGRTGLLPIDHRQRPDGEHVDVFRCPRCSREIESVVPAVASEL